MKCDYVGKLGKGAKIGACYKDRKMKDDLEYIEILFYVSERYFTLLFYMFSVKKHSH